MVYFRSGYWPQHFAAAWHTRQLLERSEAVKCPSAPAQLAGMKKATGQKWFGEFLWFFEAVYTLVKYCGFSTLWLFWVRLQCQFLHMSTTLWQWGESEFSMNLQVQQLLCQRSELLKFLTEEQAAAVSSTLPGNNSRTFTVAMMLPDSIWGLENNLIPAAAPQKLERLLRRWPRMAKNRLIHQASVVLKFQLLLLLSPCAFPMLLESVSTNQVAAICLLLWNCQAARLNPGDWVLKPQAWTRRTNVSKYVCKDIIGYSY